MNFDPARRLAGLLACLLPLLATAAPFVSSAVPDAGKMKVYVFRPAFNDQALAKEAPTLRIDGKAVGRFTQGSYAEVDLDAGTHEFSLEPGARESALWRSTFPVKAIDGRVLYLGFWVSQKLGQRVSQTAAFLVGAPLAYLLDGGNEPTELRLDLMDQVDAEPMLRECKAVAQD